LARLCHWRRRWRRRRALPPSATRPSSSDRALGDGRTAITFALGDWLRLRPGLVLGISRVGFEAGGDLSVSVGERDGTEFELYGGYVSRLGGQVGARLGWSTVPRVQMGARIEVTNFPNDGDLPAQLSQLAVPYTGANPPPCVRKFVVCP
jgi:hypothetical protein